MTRFVGFVTDFVCYTTRITMQKSRIGSRHMSRIMIQTVKENGINYIYQTQNPRVDLEPHISIRPATEADVPELKKIRRDVGFHDVPTVFETFMKLEPQGIKIAVTETGKIIGSCSTVFNGDDSDGMYFGGIYFVDPKYQKTGLGLQLFNSCMEHLGDMNIGGNSLPGLKEMYKNKGGIHVEEKDWVILKNLTPNAVPTEVLTNVVPPGVDIKPFQDSFLPEMVTYDQALVGFRRSMLLSMSCNEKDSQTYVAYKNGICVGFGSIKESYVGAGRVGPLYADDPAVAEVILRKLIESFSDKKGLMMMTISNNIHANSFLRRLNCPVEGQWHRLYSKKKLIVDTSKIYALFDTNFVVY